MGRAKVFIAIHDEEVWPVAGVDRWEVDRKEMVKRGDNPNDYRHHYRGVSQEVVEEYEAAYDEFLRLELRLRRAFKAAKHRPKK